MAGADASGLHRRRSLLKPFTTDLVEHASASGLFAELLTHGYWDDQSRIEKLVLARPWRITISVDGIGELHTRIRGRENFWAKTSKTIRTIQRVRKAHNIGTTIRLKTVIMSHNLDGVSEVARFARQGGMEVFYQPSSRTTTLRKTRTGSSTATIG